jgi:hypothetical protein
MFFRKDKLISNYDKEKLIKLVISNIYIYIYYSIGTLRVSIGLKVLRPYVLILLTKRMINLKTLRSKALKGPMYTYRESLISRSIP